ncbi:aminoacyl-tRNA hydrolase [candidate division NPL-UPA2 bacterium Unc8]|uniref:Peptidyl-tRNA hydrolase n=1 Tax=candidate division NPL-UPA2 bacterium Unc8 TaxID=1980939 RepID=A0A399FXQ0_UNCN2|nr:Peptidyl-tRNA hydrolase [Bacillota bacterium]MBT9148194.1 Peptidyl-tRNA hydrolase [Bacillota bacterium]RII01014.1 MAG: aminoacyl-tRNA hydrolase [candidate division NPL-UPA2 bacterium Unc8]
MKIVVGLGNPGEEYQDMRHNIGFKVVERLAYLIHAEFCEKGHFSLYGRRTVDKEEVILAKPTTYINRSGIAVNSFLHHYHIPSENLLIIYDDADLELGRIRIRCQGGAGGHQGINSIIHCLGTKNFQRLRIGVKGKGRSNVLTEYVLAEFTPEEQPVAEEMVVKGTEAVEFVLREGVNKAMNKYNRLG